MPAAREGLRHRRRRPPASPPARCSTRAGSPSTASRRAREVGGNWRYENDNGMSSAYRSLHINTSRRVMAYKTCPMPDDYPDYPNHFQMAALLRRLRRPLRPAREDPLPHRGARASSRSTASGRSRSRTPTAGAETQRYRAVLVANGHHWDPRWPEPAFPGSDEFEGEQIHVHHYREPEVLRRQAGAGAGDRQLGHRHRGRVLADRRRRPSWRCAAAPTSCPST